MEIITVKYTLALHTPYRDFIYYHLLFHLLSIFSPSQNQLAEEELEEVGTGRITGSEELESKVDFLYNSELLYNNNCTTEVFLLPIFNS